MSEQSLQCEANDHVRGIRGNIVSRDKVANTLATDVDTKVYFYSLLKKILINVQLVPKSLNDNVADNFFVHLIYFIF